jgi:hypothetical protein
MDQKDRPLTDEEMDQLLDSLHFLARAHETSAKIINRAIYHFEKGEYQESVQIIRSIRPKWIGGYEAIVRKYIHLFGPAPFDRFNGGPTSNN